MPQDLNLQDISEKQLKWSYWFVTHKIQLKKFANVSVLVINILLLFYIVFSVIDVFFITYSRHQTILTELVLIPQSIGNVRAGSTLVLTPLQYGSANVIRSVAKYDIITPVYNPNLKHTATFQYRYKTAAGETNWKEGFILPGETKYVFYLGLESNQLLTSAQLELKDISWSKEMHYDKTRDTKLRFVIGDIKYVPPDTLKQSKATFTVKNDSAYGFRQVGFLIILERGVNEVGVNYIKLNDFMAGETRQVESVWYEDIGAVQKVKVLPEVNILDSGVFLDI